MDTTQLLLTVVLTVTTILLIVIGIQLILVLKELRFALKRINTIVSGFEKVGTSLEQGFSEVSGFVTGLKTVLKTIDILHLKKHEKTK